MTNWYVIQTYSRSERQVAERLLGVVGVGNSFCPAVRSAAMHRGRYVTRVAGAYRGYAFARWQASDGALWHAIKETRDVVGILGGGFPWPMFPGVVEDWIDRADQEGVVPGLEPKKERQKLGYEAGDYLRLTYGAFEYVLAYCDWIDDFGAHVQIKGLLGRDQGVYLPFVSGAVLVLDRDYKPQSKTQWRRYHRRRAVLSDEKSGDGLLAISVAGG